MREIKFRGYNKFIRKMFEVNVWSERYAWGLDYSMGNSPYTTAHDLRGNTILMQSTGLKDKKGKCIYESDIVLHESSGSLPQVIEWENEKWTEEGFMTGFSEMLGTYDQYEVIGNVYENPELTRIINNGK